MRQFSVTGMSCAACSARVEKAVKAVEGVEVCSVNLLTNSMGVEGTASDSEIIKAVTDAGYGAGVKESAGKAGGGQVSGDDLEDKATPKLKARLAASLGFLVILMYFSMGHNMLSLPVPAFFDSNPLALGLLQMVLAAIVLVINQRFFTSGALGVIHGAPNMDTLVSMGSGAAFVYSAGYLFAMTGMYCDGDIQGAKQLLHGLYFESAAMILALITVGKMLEAYSKGKTTNALKSLFKLTPKTAIIIKDGKELETPVEEVKPDDIFAVKPGMSIPVDGVVTEGHSAVNEAALTGESLPVDKKVGDNVSAATINTSGFIKCRATRVGSDTTISQIIKMVSDAAATKAPIAKIADKVSGIFVPTVIAIAIVTTLVWLILGKEVGFALARGISVLVISCPCALGLATPVAIMVGNGVGARHGILFKTATALEEAGKAKTVVLDKTGTLTNGAPRVTDIFASGGNDVAAQNALVAVSASLEQKSEHPLARAIVSKAQELGIEPEQTTDFEIVPGNGLCARLAGKKIYGGNLNYVSQHSFVPEEFEAIAQSLSKKGKTPLFFADEESFLGIIAVADTLKQDSRDAVESLRKMGIRVVMLTGDNRNTAEEIGKLAGVDEVVSEVLPDGKEREIRRLSEEGKVAMVGDGINDAPALTAADTGIAIGAGADVAIDAAQIVLVNNTLSDVPAAIKLSRAVLKTIKQNLFWAFVYNAVGIPLAAGAFIGITGWEMNPMFGAAAMSLSSFCVVTNALRLNFADIGADKAPKSIINTPNTTNKNTKTEEKTMTKTIKVEGMMCPHCEAHVKKALEELSFVKEAVASHVEGTVVITLDGEADDKMIADAVNSAGYKLI